MALSWTLRDERVTSALIGASRPDQITEKRQGGRERRRFAADELAAIEAALKG
jgi:L-glyceraldehyde 3-phosphate reductase